MHPARAALALLLTCSGMGCAVEAADDAGASADAIVGGVPSEGIESIGYLSVLNPQTESLCTGTLIARDVVLTAAHCFNRWSGRLEDVVFGTGEYGSGRTFRASRVRVSPLYRTASGVDHEHDVAYVVLSRRVGGNVRTAQVRRTAHGAGCDYVTTGYGVHVEGHDPGSAIPAGGDGERRAIALCAAAGYHEDGVIRASNRRGTPCSGDSGAPLRVRNTLEIVGVLSYTFDDCVPGARVFYAPLASNLPLIDEALARSP